VPVSILNRRHGDLAWIGLCVRDEFRNRAGGHCGIDQHCHWFATESCHGEDVLKKVEIEPVIERCVDRIRSRNEEQGLTIRRGPHDRFRCKIAARTRSILDEEGLTEPLRQPLAHEPSEGVGRAAGGKADDDAHRA
jgi:hypothetical protein